MMYALVKKIFFGEVKTKTFYISRIPSDQIEEKVFLKKNKHYIDITTDHSMICLDPFCMSVWLPDDQVNLFDPGFVKIHFTKENKLNASVKLSLIEKIATEHGQLLLYKIDKLKNHQLNALRRFVLFAYLLRAKTSTYYSRRVISALYSYPRNIIIVSYRDEQYYNIFPMDIQGYLQTEGIYLLGLRTTNATLDKILEAKKVVVCDTNAVDIDTVYKLGKHSGNSPGPIEDLPFSTTKSELFGFPVPDFTGSYKEIEVIQHRKMGYHMLMVGKVVNYKKIIPNPSSLYHLGFLQFQKSNYTSIDGIF